MIEDLLIRGNECRESGILLATLARPLLFSLAVIAVSTAYYIVSRSTKDNRSAAVSFKNIHVFIGIGVFLFGLAWSWWIALFTFIAIFLQLLLVTAHSQIVTKQKNAIIAFHYASIFFAAVSMVYVLYQQCF